MAPRGRDSRRIVILCEGETEEIAVRHFVGRQWRTEGLQAVGLRTIDLKGRLQDIGPKAQLFLDEQNVLAVFSLIDLYNMDRVTHSQSDPLETKTHRVREWLKQQVKHARSDYFRPHVSVHETEAWILAEGFALAERLNDPGIRPDPNAEQKNLQRPPSQRINELFQRNSRNRYQKILDGQPLFSKMQFDPVYRSCRNFQLLYDDLHTIAAEAI